MSNILTAIQAIIENTATAVDTSQTSSQNRATQMGDALEDFVKNAFANCFGKDKTNVIAARSNVFSYLGNSTNPPDAMLKGGDAIEIKKLITLSTNQLQLNSSFPKNKLHSDNPKICKSCRECETWTEKDMIYVIGQVNEQQLQNIFFIYGDLYCDAPEIYKNIEDTIKSSFDSLEGVEFAETNELGRVNKVDHLEISDLRIRGMWLIKSPFHHFDYLIQDIKYDLFRLVALIPTEKYDSFTNRDAFENFCSGKGVNISEVDIPDPQNPAKIIKSKLITVGK